MKKNKVMFICAIGGILMVSYPIIGMFLFFDRFFNLTIIFLYSGLYAGFLTLFGAIISKMDYSLLGIDYIKIGINSIRIGIILGLTSLMVFIVLSILNIILFDKQFILTIIFLVIYTGLEFVGIFLGILSIRKFKEVILLNPRKYDVINKNQ